MSNCYFHLKLKEDNLIINTKAWVSSLSTESYSFEDLKKYYAKIITSPDLIVKVTVHGLSPYMTFKHEYIRLKDIQNEDKQEDHEITFLIINDDLFGRHLRAILEIIAPIQVKTDQSCETYKICLPNHFEAFDIQNQLIPTDVVLKKLEDNSIFDITKSSCLLVVGKSFDEEFKNPIKILGLTQIKLHTYS